MAMFNGKTHYFDWAIFHSYFDITRGYSAGEANSFLAGYATRAGNWIKTWWVPSPSNATRGLSEHPGIPPNCKLEILTTRLKLHSCGLTSCFSRMQHGQINIGPWIWKTTCSHLTWLVMCTVLILTPPNLYFLAIRNHKALFAQQNLSMFVWLNSVSFRPYYSPKIW